MKFGGMYEKEEEETSPLWFLDYFQEKNYISFVAVNKSGIVHPQGALFSLEILNGEITIRSACSVSPELGLRRDHNGRITIKII